MSDYTAASEAVPVVLFVSLAGLPVGFEVAFVLLGSPFVCLKNTNEIGGFFLQLTEGVL